MTLGNSEPDRGVLKSRVIATIGAIVHNINMPKAPKLYGTILDTVKLI